MPCIELHRTVEAYSIAIFLQVSTLDDKQQELSSKPYSVVAPVHFTTKPAARQRMDTPAAYAAPVQQIERVESNQRNTAQAVEASPQPHVHYGLLVQQRDTLKDQILASKQLKKSLEPNSAGLSLDFEKVIPFSTAIHSTRIKQHNHRIWPFIPRECPDVCTGETQTAARRTCRRKRGISSFLRLAQWRWCLSCNNANQACTDHVAATSPAVCCATGGRAKNQGKRSICTAETCGLIAMMVQPPGH